MSGPPSQQSPKQSGNQKGRRKPRKAKANGNVDTKSTSPTSTKDEHSNKFKTFRIRLYSTIVLVSTFAIINYIGHVPVMFMVLGIQGVMVKELFTLARVAQQERKIPGFRAQQWYFAFVAAFWVYIRFIKNNLMVEISSNAQLARFFGWVLRRHTLLSFTLYTAGFLAFVLSLQKGMYTYQFTQYAWTHMILMVVMIPSSFFVSQIFEGLIWFLLPTALVIINDIMAYLAGFFFGRTPLIKLSPKKTWEGFIGGFIGTLIASWYLAAFMSKSAWLTCPRTDLSVWKPMECTEPPETFQLKMFTSRDVLDNLPMGVADGLVKLGNMYIRPDIRDRIADFTVECLPMQIHAAALALFASAIAPFGGFFASGFKRGFKIKDFGDSIPGHGGMTDRMDCQIAIATFSYIYFHSFVAKSQPTVGAVLATAMKLTSYEQIELLEHLSNVLVATKMLPGDLGKAIGKHVQKLQLGGRHNS